MMRNYTKKITAAIGMVVLAILSLNVVAKEVSNLRVDSLTFPDGQSKPMACVELNYPQSNQTEHLEDYLQLESSLDSDATIKTRHSVHLQQIDDRLCFGDLNYGKHYFVTFRSGFPLGDDHFVVDDYDYSFIVADKKPEIKFQTATYVLPTIHKAQVPVKVVNHHSAELQVFRLSPEQVQENMAGGQFFRSYSGYDLDRLRRSSQLIGNASIDFDNAKNEAETYNLDLSEVMQGQSPGAYLLAIKTDDRRWEDRPVQTLIYTDIGLSSYKGSDGLHVYARSYQSALPKAGLSIQLVGRNHDVLASAVTDELGKVLFNDALMRGQYGHQPVQIRHLGDDGEYAVLNLTGQSLDLSDRPVNGSTPLGLLNAYLFSERGVYRLGEDVVITGLVRDKQLAAVDDLPLTLKVIRPDGDVAIMKKIDSLRKGGFQQRFVVPSSGRTGQWKASLYLNTQGSPIGTLTFEVADYVPETIEVDLSNETAAYINDPLDIQVQSDFLYGAPAKNLDVESSVTISQNRRLFDQYKDFVFGSSDAFDGDFNRLNETKTDASGKAVVQLPNGLLRKDWIHHALEAKVRVQVIEPSGRAAIRSLNVPALQHVNWIGIKAAGDYPVYDKDKPVIFNVISITDTQSITPNARLKYELIEEDWDYHYYYNDGRWRYKVSKYDHQVVATGRVSTAENGIATIDMGSLDWGRYRIVVTNTESGQRTELPFRNGWWNADGSQSAMPDNVQIVPLKKSVTVGEELQVKVKAPYAGQLHLLVATDSIVEERLIDLASNETEVSIEIQEDWGQQVYLLASVYRPGGANVGPARAIGVSHVKIERPELHANIAITAPEKVRPGEEVDIQLATDLPAGSQVMLAAVDEGILQLTRYQSPNPNKWYLKKQRLDLDVRDLYGHLIQHKDGEQLRLNFGGDGDTGAPEAPPLENFVKPVALVTKLVDVDAEGNAKLAMEFPQFNGRVRLMAVGFGEQAMGASNQNMIVRHPLVVQPNLPRFLALNDEAEIGVSLHNIELPKGNIDVSWQVTDGLVLEKVDSQLVLDMGERKSITTTVQAVAPGVNKISLRIKSEHQPEQTYEWDMTVVFNRLLETHYQKAYIEPGERQTLRSQVGDLEIGSRSLELLASSTPIVPTGWLTKSLSRYPFGCLEQTTSKAWPILMLNKERDSANLQQRDKHIAKAITHLSTMQLRDGSFSLWSGGTTREHWLSMYATEFLIEAKERGHKVPELMLDRATNFVINYNGNYEAARAYAYYLRAKLGEMDAGALRYFTNQSLKANYRTQVYMHLMMANDLMGAYDKIDGLWEKARIGAASYWYRSDYSSPVRDAALGIYATLSLSSSNAEQKEQAFIIVQELFQEAQDKRWLSTQEKAWLLRLADQLGEAEKLSEILPVSLDFQDMRLGDVADYLVKQDSWTSFKNKSEETMYLSMTSTGFNKSLSDAASHNGTKLKTRYYDLATGKEISLRSMKVGTEVLVRHKIEITSGTDTELSLEAAIPAGFELEVPRLSGERPEVSELKKTPPTFEEFRDDRYMAAWSLPRGYRSLNEGDSTIAYVMRAVTPGEFIVPAAQVEDMYRPQYHANTAESTVLITP